MADWSDESNPKNEGMLSTDDLVLMIGEKEVWMRQKDRQIAVYQKSIVELSKEVSVLKSSGERIKVLELSNKTLSDKNIEFGNVISALRNVNTNISADNQNLTIQLKTNKMNFDILSVNFKNKEKDFSAKEDEILRLNNLLKRRSKRKAKD